MNPIIPLFEHTPRKYWKAPKTMNVYGTANKNRKHFITTGETVYIISIHGNQIRFNKLDNNGEPDKSVEYIDKKSNYIY